MTAAVSSAPRDADRAFRSRRGSRPCAGYIPRSTLNAAFRVSTRTCTRRSLGVVGIVRSQDDIRQRVERRIDGSGSGTTTSSPAAARRPSESAAAIASISTMSAAGGVDQYGGRLDLVEERGVDHAAGFVGQRAMERDDVRLGGQLVERDQLDAGRRGDRGSEIGIVDDDAQPERLRRAGRPTCPIRPNPTMPSVSSRRGGMGTAQDFAVCDRSGRPRRPCAGLRWFRRCAG